MHSVSPPPSSPPAKRSKEDELIGRLYQLDANAEGDLCANTCPLHHDGDCDDGGPTAQYVDCSYGSDCSDCGPRESFICSNRCYFQVSVRDIPGGLGLASPSEQCTITRMESWMESWMAHLELDYRPRPLMIRSRDAIPLR